MARTRESRRPMEHGIGMPNGQEYCHRRSWSSKSLLSLIRANGQLYHCHGWLPGWSQSLVVLMNSIIIQDILPHRPRNLCFIGSSEPCMASCLSNTAPLRISPLTVPILLDQQQCHHRPIHRQQPRSIEEAVCSRGEEESVRGVSASPADCNELHQLHN